MTVAGYGLAQWTWWEYKEALYDFAKAKGVSVGDEDMQIEFLVNEYLWSNDAWENASSPEEAAEIFCNVYERPNIYGEGKEETYKTVIGNRQSMARTYYEQFAGGYYQENTDETNPYISGYYTSSFGRVFVEYRQGAGESSSWVTACWSDSRGAYHTIASAGCGVYAAATLISSAGVDGTDKDFMWNVYQKAGGTACTLTDSSYTGAMRSYYGSRMVTSRSGTDAYISILSEGKGIMVWMGPGDFTGGTHWIVLADIRESTLGSSLGYDVYVLTSGTVGKGGHGWQPIEKIEEQRGASVCYYIDSDLEISDEEE